MTYYNLYYQSNKINSNPLNERDLNEFNNSSIIYYKNKISQKLEEIPRNKIKVIPCVLIKG